MISPENQKRRLDLARSEFKTKLWLRHFQNCANDERNVCMTNIMSIHLSQIKLHRIWMAKVTLKLGNTTTTWQCTVTRLGENKGFREKCIVSWDSTAIDEYGRFKSHRHWWKAIRASKTALCNRPSETRPSEYFAFTQWKFSPRYLHGGFVIWPGQFVASPVRLLHTQHIPIVYVWKRQNSDLTERGNLVENFPTRWGFFQNPVIDATGSVTKGWDKINWQVFAGSLVRAAQGFLVHTGLLWRVNILRKTLWRFLVFMYQAPNSKQLCQ